MSTIGLLACDTINWNKGHPFAHSASYRQSGRDGVGHVVGPTYSDPSTIRSTHLVGSKASEYDIVFAAKIMCGKAYSVVEDNMYGTPETTADVFIESFKIVKSNAVAYSATKRYIVVVEWTVYIPV